MAIFLITPLANNFEGIKKAIESQALDMMEVQNSAGILVNFQGTSVELSNKIGITREDDQKSELGAALVTSIGSYYGIAKATMWEWMKTRLERGL